MSMTNEELEKTGVLKIMLDKDNSHDIDEMTVGERLEELEDKLDYLDIDDDRREKINNLMKEIRKESEESTKEFLFNHLMKFID